MGVLLLKKNKHLGIRIDEDLHYKLHYVAKADGRSANGEILYLIRQYIRNYEEINGIIKKKEEDPKV